MSWETRIAHLRGLGYTDDEIAGQFDSEVARAKRPGDTLDWSDDGSMLDWATLHGRRHIGALIGPGAALPWRPSGQEWVKLVREYRKTGDKRPSIDRVAEEYGYATAQPIRDIIHRIGITRWHDVHALVDSEPR